MKKTKKRHFEHKGGIITDTVAIKNNNIKNNFRTELTAWINWTVYTYICLFFGRIQVKKWVL